MADMVDAVVLVDMGDTHNYRLQVLAMAIGI